MPSAKAEVGSRAAQLMGFPRKFMVSLINPTYEIATQTARAQAQTQTQTQTRTQT